MRLHGRLDVLHNNVGHAGMSGSMELPEAEWDYLLDLNRKGVFLACRHALPIMLRQSKGAIITISSIAAIRWTGYPYAGYYAAKAGVNQLTVSWRCSMPASTRTLPIWSAPVTQCVQWAA